MLSKPQSTSSQRSLGDKILYWKRFFCQPFRTMIGSFSVFVGKNSIGLAILHTTCLRKNSEDKKMDVERKIFQFGRKIAAGWSKLPFTCSWEQFERKNFLEQFQFLYIYPFSKRKEVRLLTKLIWPSCENCILRVHWKNLRIKIWIQIFSRHWRKSNQFSLQNYWQCLSKLHYTCP